MSSESFYEIPFQIRKLIKSYHAGIFLGARSGIGRKILIGPTVNQVGKGGEEEVAVETEINSSLVNMTVVRRMKGKAKVQETVTVVEKGRRGEREEQAGQEVLVEVAKSTRIVVKMNQAEETRKIKNMAEKGRKEL